MPQVTIAPNGQDSISVAVAVSNLAADGALDVQYSIRPDFQLALAPIISVARAGFTLAHLNSGTTYYIRARSVRASGVVEDWSNTIAMTTSAGSARNLAPASVMIDDAIIVVPAPIISIAVVHAFAGYPATNLLQDSPAIWSSLDQVTAQRYAATFETGATPIDTIALLGTNAPESATIRIYAGNTAACGDYATSAAPFRASANLPSRPSYHSLVRLPAPQSYRYWQVEVNATVPGGVFQATHLVVGLNRRTKTHAVDKTEQGIDLGTLDFNRAGHPVRQLGQRRRTVDFDLGALTEAQYEAAYADLDWRVGQTEPVLVVPNSKAGSFLHDRILYGPLTGGRIINPVSPRFTRQFSINSAI